MPDPATDIALLARRLAAARARIDDLERGPSAREVAEAARYRAIRASVTPAAWRALREAVEQARRTGRFARWCRQPPVLPRWWR